MPRKYCKRCKCVTDHKTIGEGSGNSEVECSKCGTRKVLIQGFDADLM